MRPGKFRSCLECCLAETSEPGIRMALGAQRDQLLQLIAVRWSASAPTAVQPRLWPAVELLGNTHLPVNAFWNQALDPVVLSGEIAELLAVAVLACLAPAWRASRLDPLQALRTE